MTKSEKKMFLQRSFEKYNHIEEYYHIYLRDVDYDEKGRGKIVCAWESRLALFLQACPQKSILAGCIMVFKISRQHLSLSGWLLQKNLFFRGRSLKKHPECSIFFDDYFESILEHC